MDGLTCDACGEPLLLASDTRYVLRIEGFAAYDPLEITREDLNRDLEEEMRGVLEELSRLDPASAQDEVHRSFLLDLCPRCWREYVKDPLAGLRRDRTRAGLEQSEQGGEIGQRGTQAGEQEEKEKSQGD